MSNHVKVAKILIKKIKVEERHVNLLKFT